jgi:hypothetical protein
MATEHVEDARLAVPLYTSAEAARYLAVKDATIVQGQLKAGEPVADIAGDFDLPLDEVAEVAQREGLLVA